MSNGKKVLVIDDDPDITRFVRSALTGAGYEVLTAGGGEEGLAVMTVEKPDILLLDILMPGMSGLEMLRRLGKGTPVIVFCTNPATCVEAIRLGAVDFVPKPFRPDDLLSRIAHLLGSTPSPVEV